MENQSGIAGKSTRDMAAKRRKTALWIGLGGFALILFIGLVFQYSPSVELSGIGFFFLLFGAPILKAIFKLVFNKYGQQTKRAIRGAKAEEKIGELLAGLSEDFFVLNDVECPYGNIDHIVISKIGGIFLLETKAHGGQVKVENETLLVNGKFPEKDFLAQTLKNTYWLRDTISQITGSKPWITPVIVFTNAFVVASKPIKGVRIINKKYLLGLLNEATVNTSSLLFWNQRDDIQKKLPSHLPQF
jgi:hypothetical protein